MTIKTITIDHHLGYGMLNDIYGGQEMRIQVNPELVEVISWWKEWGPVFRDLNPTVTDALVQAKMLHELSRNQQDVPPC
jgi:hypothetical protein